MRKAFVLAILASAVGACGHTPADQPQRGLEAVNVPVVVRNDYVLDVSAPDGMLSPSEAGRLDGWFRGLELGYGDVLYVDGLYAEGIRADVARIAGQYGLLLSRAAPVTAGQVPEGVVRVVVSRNRAVVTGCPNWSEASQPNYQNRMLSNFGCGVNSNYAAMVANPTDLVHGQEAGGVGDNDTAAKAIDMYRTTPPTGKNGLQKVNTKSSGGN
jgi:pilus assembly protein CpaD